MNREDIIAMAKEATKGGIEIAVFTVEELELFVALIIKSLKPSLQIEFEKMFMEGAICEREACAKICDEADKDSDWPTAANCAAAIRARNKQ